MRLLATLLAASAMLTPGCVNERPNGNNSGYVGNDEDRDNSPEDNDGDGHKGQKRVPKNSFSWLSKAQKCVFFSLSCKIMSIYGSKKEENALFVRVKKPSRKGVNGGYEDTNVQLVFMSFFHSENRKKEM